MKSKIKKVCLCLLALVIILSNVQPMAVKACLLPPSEYRYTPKVLTEEITERTTSIPVYVFDETTLYIKNGKEVIFQKFYQKGGLKNVRIKNQKGGSKLKFYLIAKSSGKRGDVVTKKITKLPVVAPEQIDTTITKPVIPKTITSKTTNIPVIGKKNTTLVVKNEKKTLKTIKFQKNGKKKITIPAQDKGILYFYLKKGNSRSEVVSRNIKDVTAPKAPKLKFSDGDLLIKGELGAKIYFKGENGWRFLNFVLTKDWNHFWPGLDFMDTQCEYYEVYLKDAAGNKSKVVKIKNPNPGLPPLITP